MFIPTKRKWTGTSANKDSTPKFTIDIKANFEPISGGTSLTSVRFPVLASPVDTAKPQFSIPDRKTWRMDDWTMGWGQRRFDVDNAYWYGSAYTFRDGEISAGAAVNNPTTNISANSVEGFCEYGASNYSDELLSNTAFTSATTGWTASHATLSSESGGQAGNCLKVVNNTEGQYGYAYATIQTTEDELYKFTIYVKKGTADYVWVKVGTDATSGQIFSGQYNDADWTLKTIYFTAEGDTTYIRLGTDSTTNAETAYFDTLSIKQYGSGVGSSRGLYAWCGEDVYAYSFTNEGWVLGTGIPDRDSDTTKKSKIIELSEQGGKFYLSQWGVKHWEYDGSTWSQEATAYILSHFCYHDGSIYAAGDPSATPSTANTIRYGSSWANSITVGGAEDNINAMISYGNDMVVLKSDGVYVVGSKPQDTTIVDWQPKVMPVQTFTSERSQNTGKHWAVWSDRLWFNAGTSLAYYDGLDVVLIDYPWSVAPTQLGEIYSIVAMDDALLVGFAGYVLAYTDSGAGTQAKWHCAAYLGSTTRTPLALWFTRLSDPNRIFIGLDTDTANNTKYLKMYAGLFLPYTFAASSEIYLSWFDDSDQTINKWLMEAYIETDNCDDNNYITFYYAQDGSDLFTAIGSPIHESGITRLPTTGFVDNGSLVSFRSIQLKAVITSAGTVAPIIKAIEVVFQPKPPDRRQFDYTLLCSSDWEVGSWTGNYTAKQYRDFLWGAAGQNTPVILTDEYGDSYTVSMTLVETAPYTEEGVVNGMKIRVHMEEP